VGASSSDLVSTGALGDWYVKPLFWRPQVALFVSQRSLLPVLVPFAPVASVVRRRPRRIAEIATRLGVGASALGSGLVAMENHVLAKTKSRSVLGVINDFAHQADHYRWAATGWISSISPAGWPRRPPDRCPRVPVGRIESLRVRFIPPELGPGVPGALVEDQQDCSRWRRERHAVVEARRTSASSRRLDRGSTEGCAR